MYWEKETETMPRDRLKEFQLARLKKSVEKASASVFYGELFKKTGLDSNGIRSLEDIKRFLLRRRTISENTGPMDSWLSPRMNW